MKKLIVISAALLVLSGCEYLSPSVRDAKSAIERRLKDPASAIYRDVVVYSDGTVCGEWNSKNGAGGYGGFESFVFLPNPSNIHASDLDMSADATATNRHCNDKPKRAKLLELTKIVFDQEIKRLQALCGQAKAAGSNSTHCIEGENLVILHRSLYPELKFYDFQPDNVVATK